MRKLQTSDVFEFMRIIRKANMREDLKPIIKAAATEGAKPEDIGIDGMLSIMEILTEKKAEHALYEALAGPFEITKDEIAKLDINTLLDMLTALAEENDLKRFFTFVHGLLSKS